MHCIFWKFLVVSTENKFLFEDSFNVLFVRIIFLWFFMIFIMAYLWKGFSCGFYDFLHAIFVVMVFVVFCFNPLWFLWFLWFLWSSTFYSFILPCCLLACPSCQTHSIFNLMSSIITWHKNGRYVSLHLVHNIDFVFMKSKAYLYLTLSIVILTPVNGSLASFLSSFIILSETYPYSNFKP